VTSEKSFQQYFLRENIAHAYKTGLTRNYGEGNHLAKLSVSVVKRIRESEEVNSELARLFGVTNATIWAVRAGKTWRHV
jgi:DNA-binding transcriptional regulator YiaG